MNSNEIRSKFIEFFKSKQHQYVHSAPLVVKNDPSLMFTNAGMNQFKDIFLGNINSELKRVANSQKCLRVSGKHNDLEEVGHDTYHHTMFEMLGNWSFGDYFKKEAISWAWELLTEVYGLEKDRLYVTIFEGSNDDNLEQDIEAKNYWKNFIDEDRIINGSKKDNFWEMGETGPCGPCSEIHIDLRDAIERKKISGKELVNTSNPLVIEIWNLVFIQFNRKADGSLESLPAKHVDTGMGFERLCMALQNKKSNYDTDVFQPIINEISNICGIKYGKNEKSDIAMRVISDHIRAISFAIADGQLPSNNKAGYVIRRILRRAVRYGYTFLKIDSPFLFKLVNVLNIQLGHYFKELTLQKELIEKVIFEEENSFLKTLDTGIRILDSIIEKSNLKEIDGKIAFDLYDTYGFPIDLTQLIAKEKGIDVNITDFEKELEIQKNRSRNASSQHTDDWVIVSDAKNTAFTGYDSLYEQIKILKYRKVTSKSQVLFQLVFDKTPFYAESGGQVGDIGIIKSINETIYVTNTIKENNLIIHIAENLPENLNSTFEAIVDINFRKNIQKNHSATHLLHNSLRNILGAHVEQKGSLVNNKYLRFDFSHFQKLTDDEIHKIERKVNSEIRENRILNEKRDISINEANKIGAIALFGEKYGETVRVIQFGDSIELCGGTHVLATGEIGFFKIISESAIAAGIRRIEAITGENAEDYIEIELNTLNKIKDFFKNPKDIIKSIDSLSIENIELKKKLENFSKLQIESIKKNIKNKITIINGINVIAEKIETDNASEVKDLIFQLKNEIPNLFCIIGAEINEKALLSIIISDSLVKEKNLNAGQIIKDISKFINGGGGGQAFYATCGGSNADGIINAINNAISYIK